MKKIYVTGIGFISSIGNSWSEVSSSLKELKTGIELYPPFQKPEIPVKLAGTVKNFITDSIDPEDWVYPSDYRVGRGLLRSLAPNGLYAFCAIEQALKQAGLTGEDISNLDTGLHTASAGSVVNLRHYINRMHDLGVERMGPKAVVSSIAGTLNFCLASHYKIKGHSCGFVSACASSGHAIGYAMDEIRAGRQSRMIVVGAEDGDLDTLLPFAGMRAMSTDSDPKMAAKPFDKDRSGFVGTGGATAMILESEECANERNADSICELISWGQASDGYSAVLPEPDGKGVAQSMKLALQHGEIEPSEIDYINAHATGTIPGDIAELRAIKSVFGDDCQAKIAATKALTGHGLSLSTILELGITAVGLKEGYCPGTAHLENPDSEIGDLNVIADTVFEAPSVALSNSSGFGGANVSVVLGKS